MAVTHIFDTYYNARQSNNTNSRGRYRMIIGDSTGTVTDTVSELSLMDPGMSLQWQGDDNMSRSLMGSSLSFTAILNDDQLSTIEDMMDTNEGDIFCLFFNSGESNANPYWYGHLLKESVAIQVANNRHVVDMEFTDGLGSLRGKEWKDESDELYTGFKKLSFYLREIISKMPAYEGYKDYITSSSHLNLDDIPLISTVAWPAPEESSSKKYTVLDDLLDHSRVRAQTFNKPKKQVERIRELEAPYEYMNAADVLEDICKCFGATAAIFEGRLNLACRLDLASMKGDGVYRTNYDYDPVADSWTVDTRSRVYQNENADDQYAVLAGATKGYTIPVYQANITHEEGGSDALIMEGYYVNSGGAINALDTTDSLIQSLVATSSNGTGDGPFNNLYATGVRRDIMYRFGEATLPTVDLGFFVQPKDPATYMGFPSETVDDLEFQSGEQMRIQFGGNFRLDVGPLVSATTSSELHRVHVGSVVIVRCRIQFTTTGDVGYRLSRTVHTHVKTGSNQDYINIDNVRAYYDINDESIVLEDRRFFRKLYNDIEWVKSDAGADYTDAWFEIIVPHGDNENSGDDYGAPITQLTELYGGQPSYAPIGTQLDGDNSGAGVILKTEDDATLMQYFQEDLKIALPYGDDDEQVTLDFESFYFEMGAAEYEHDAGPRGNASAETGWRGDLPLWKSAYADGTGGSKRFTGSSASVSYPQFFHFTGLKIAMGDGSESADLTTKATGGDGYEVVNLGSSRLGSRKAFVNTHVSGTLFAQKKDTSANGDFTSPVAYDENLQWRGHAAGLVSSPIPNTAYDSIHRYYADAYLQLFGKSREVYSMSLVTKATAVSYRSLRNPFEVLKMNTLLSDKGFYEYLMPLSYTWTLNDGIQGSFLKIGQNRDISSIQSDEGRPVRGGGGGIIGMPPGVSVLNEVSQIKDTTDRITITSDIDLDAVRDDVTVNTGKVSFPGFGTTADKALPGNTQTIEDIDDLPVLARTDGTEDPVTVVAENPDLLVLAVQSKVSGQQGVKKFTVQELFQGIIQGGLQDMEDGGYIEDVADYEGSTYGVLGDFDDDGSVTTQDLLAFLTLFGSIYVGDNGAFLPAEVEIQSVQPLLNFFQATDASAQYFNFIDSELTVNPAGVSINTYGSNESPANTIEFVSGTNPLYPITSWTEKKVRLKAISGESLSAHFTINDQYPGQIKHLVVNIKTYDGSGTELNDYEEIVSIIINSQAGSNTHSFIDLFGSSFYTVPVSLSSSSIEKIQVRVGIKPAILADRFFSARMIKGTIVLASATT